MKTLIVLREELKNHGTHHILDEILKHERPSKKHQNLDVVESLQHEIENLEFQYNNVLSKFEKELSKKDDVILKQSVGVNPQNSRMSEGIILCKI